MAHYHNTGDQPSRQEDKRDETYASPSHYDDTGQETTQAHLNSDYADTSADSTRLDLIKEN